MPAIYLLFSLVCILASAAFGYAYVHWIGFLPDAWWMGASVATGVAGAFSGIFAVLSAADDP